MEFGYMFRKSAFDNPQHWEIKEQGLLCTDTKTKEKQLFPYDDIQSIRMQFQPYRDFRHNNFRCRITLTNGKIIDILSTSYVGFADFNDEAETYTPFVRELVKVTRSENPNCIIYLGQTPSAFNGNLVLIIVAIVFAFILMISFPIGQGHLLGLLVIVIGAWQYLKISKNINRPQQTNNTEEIPDYVLPAAKRDADSHVRKQSLE